MTELENQDNYENKENPLETLPVWSEEDYKNNQDWMKKSKRKIISFGLFTLLIILFIFLFHTNELFIFSSDNTSSELAGTTLLFNILSYTFIFITFIYMFYYVDYFFRRLKLTPEEQMESFSSFKKHYNAFDLLGVVPVFLAVLTLINGFFFGFATVIGPSMEPTFCPNDYVVIEHYYDTYQRDDIVIFIHSDQKLIKRLVGIPGDTLVVNNLGVTINGVLVESSISGTYHTYDTVIPEGYYYFMGDNRGNSNDSRYFGLVSKDLVLGKVVFTVSNSTCDIE